jgi:hypothetical protein
VVIIGVIDFKIVKRKVLRICKGILGSDKGSIIGLIDILFLEKRMVKFCERWNGSVFKVMVLGSWWRKILLKRIIFIRIFIIFKLIEFNDKVHRIFGKRFSIFIIIF